MGMPDIFLEHSKGQKVHKLLRVKPERHLFVIGSSRSADLKLSGEGVAGCHAALRYRAPNWYICNLSTADTLKVNDLVVTESLVDGSAKVEIAGHQIKLFTKERDAALFKDSDQNSDLALHQVVVKRKGQVVETHLLRANEAFTFKDGDVKHTLAAPNSGAWISNQFGSREVQQRLVGAQQIIAAEKITFDRDLRKHFASALIAFVVIIGSVLLMKPSKNETAEVLLDKKSMDIIFSAKAVEKKKAESKQVVKAAKARAGGSTQQANAPVAKNSAPEESMAPKVTEKSTRALTSIRKAGLSSLVGKIAKRANKQGVLVAAVGVSPDKEGSGRAFYSTGTSTVGGGGSASKEGKGYRLGGVGTQGKAGGTGNFKDGTALAGGSVGSGNLVALVDEETVIEGGLDRDAIAEVIRRNLGQIRYCYERQLSSNPELYGKVLVKWTIGAGGEVANPRVDTSTLKSAMVEGCVLRRMASWKFPLPKGGTQVNVAYPFLFKALD